MLYRNDKRLSRQTRTLAAFLARRTGHFCLFWLPPLCALLLAGCSPKGDSQKRPALSVEAAPSSDELPRASQVPASNTYALPDSRPIDLQSEGRVPARALFAFAKNGRFDTVEAVSPELVYTNPDGDPALQMIFNARSPSPTKPAIVTAGEIKVIAVMGQELRSSMDKSAMSGNEANYDPLIMYHFDGDPPTLNTDSGSVVTTYPVFAPHFEPMWDAHRQEVRIYSIGPGNPFWIDFSGRRIYAVAVYWENKNRCAVSVDFRPSSSQFGAR